MGSVKMNYMREAAAGVHAAAAEPTHILADRAELEHATQIATFFGKPVRMWQGGNQVQAPVIEFARAERRLIARGEAGTGWSAAAQAAQVRTVLSAAASDVSGTAKSGAGAQTPACSTGAAKTGAGKAGAEARAPDVVRIASGGLIYSDILRQADFTGGFRADTVDGTIRAGAGTVYMQKAGADAASGSDAAGPSLGGSLERVVAAGHVELDKPGMHATGERLTYTASDRMVLLTGDAKNPPKAIGAQGTTTGAALRFNSCDGSVEAVGGPGQRVLTDAQVSGEGKKEKGKQ
jgi:lipopolysaccharide export system protein LptA